MKLENARALAESLVEEMTPYCHKIQIAGSIRREKPEVKDLEIVAVPKWETRAAPGDLFGDNTEDVNLLHEWAMRRAHLAQEPVAPGVLRPSLMWIKPGTSEIIEWTPKDAGKYWRAYLPCADVKLDLFLAKPTNWGAILLIRTGSAEFSEAVVTHGKRIGRPFKDGQVWWGERPMVTADEETVFRLLHLACVAPQERHGIDQVRGESRETME